MKYHSTLESLYKMQEYLENNGEANFESRFGLKPFQLDNLINWQRTDIKFPTTAEEIENANPSQVIFWWRFIPQNSEVSRYLMKGICYKFNQLKIASYNTANER